MKLTRRRIRKKSSRVKRRKVGRKTKNCRKSFRKKRTKGRRRRRGETPTTRPRATTNTDRVPGGLL